MGQLPLELAFEAETIIVSEIFGPTFQGEGRHIGVPCLFLRLGNCNLACDWCDTRYSWDWNSYDPKEQLNRSTIQDVANELDIMSYGIKTYSNNPNPIRYLVISGGEPMLQQRKVVDLITTLSPYNDIDWTVEIETAGTIPLDINYWETHIGDSNHVRSPKVHFNISPKLLNSGLANKRIGSIVDSALLSYKDYTNQGNNYTSDFKFVVEKVNDLAEVGFLVDKFNIESDKVFIMPLGTSKEAIANVSGAIADRVIQYGWRLTTRLHVLAWGDERGK